GNPLKEALDHREELPYVPRPSLHQRQQIDPSAKDVPLAGEDACAGRPALKRSSALSKAPASSRLSALPLPRAMRRIVTAPRSSNSIMVSSPQTIIPEPSGHIPIHRPLVLVV